jgi:hypothetical protein
MPINVIRVFLQDDSNEGRYAYVSLIIESRDRLCLFVKSNGIPYSLEGFYLELRQSSEDAYNARPIVSATKELGRATSREDMKIAISLTHETVAKLAIDTDLTVKAIMDDSEGAFARAMLVNEGDISLEIMGELLE